MNIRTFFQQMSKTRILFLSGAVIIIGFVIFRITSSSQQQPQYQTAQAQQGTLVVAITASGQISSVNNTSVTTAASGVVKNIYVKNGDPVQGGQPIAELQLDQNGLQKQQAAYASYLSAVNSQNTAQQNKPLYQSQLEAARKAVIDASIAVNAMNDNRNNGRPNPATKQPYTQEEIDSINSALTSARESFTSTEKKYLQSDTAIGAANASVSSAWLSYQQTSSMILAPLTGTITGMSLQVGTVVGSSENTASSTSTNNTSSSANSQKIASVTTGATPLVMVNLTEIDVPKVKIGNKATLTLDAFPGKTYTGVISSIDTTGEVNSGVTTYPTVIKLDTDASEIYPNMSASANIITQTKDNVLLVPASAVQTQEGQSTVRIVKNGELQVVPVEIGSSSDTQVEIISGVKEGDAVVTTLISTAGTQQRGAASPFSGFGGGRGFSGGGGTFRIAR